MMTTMMTRNKRRFVVFFRGLLFLHLPWCSLTCLSGSFPWILAKDAFTTNCLQFIHLNSYLVLSMVFVLYLYFVTDGQHLAASQWRWLPGALSDRWAPFPTREMNMKWICNEFETNKINTINTKRGMVGYGVQKYLLHATNVLFTKMTCLFISFFVYFYSPPFHWFSLNPGTARISSTDVFRLI